MGILSGLTWRIGALIAAGLAGLFFLGLATQTIRIEGFKLWPLHIVGFKEEVKTLRLDLDTIKVMQLAAKEKAEAERLRMEAEYQEKAEKADDEYRSKLADASARAAAYANRMRVQAPYSASSGSGASTESNPATSADRSSEDAEYIAVTRSDFDVMIENTLRLKAAHEWAVGLNAER